MEAAMKSYDLSRFERKTTIKEDKARAAEKAKKRASRRKQPRISSFSILTGLIVFVTLIALLYSYVSLNEASDINSRRQITLSELREDIQMLEVSKNQRLGALQIRDHAVTKLGMSKIDKSQITYVTTSDGDRFEIGMTEEKKPSKLVAGLAKGFSTIVEFIN